MGSCIICTHHRILLGRSNQGDEVGGDRGTHGRGEKGVQGFGGKRPLGRPRRRWDDGIKMDLRMIGRGVWSGFTWLNVWIIGGLL
jgi:hypothetical protein